MIRGYIQNLRIYSFVDLILLLYAAKLSLTPFVGALALWIGFLLYLEWRHKHSYRSHSPILSWILFFTLGTLLFPFPWGIAFVLTSILYSEKKLAYGGIFSPFARGLQSALFLIPFVTFYSPLLGIAPLATTLRNILGDVRDAKKDFDNNMKTIPVLLGLRKNIPYVHLLGVLSTTLLWWSFTTLPFFIVLLLWIIEIMTYKLTPR